MDNDWPEYYILVGRTPVAVDLMTWGKTLQGMGNRRVARTDVTDTCHVSTVFLGLNHNYTNRGDPILFETMIFGGPLDGDQWRYCTYEQAERGHAKAVSLAKKACALVKAIGTAAGIKA